MCLFNRYNNTAVSSTMNTVVKKPRAKKPLAIKQAKGITIIEVLVSMLILSFGLLGVAGLQTASLRNNQSAYYRSQATAAAEDIIDRMRANAAGVTAGDYDALDSDSLPNDPNCINTGCNAAQLAAHDVRDWVQNTLSLLPSSHGTVAVDTMGTNTDPSDDVFVVTIDWNDVTDQNNPNKNLVINVQL
jgi:type IV pilus assembly protein PilV